MIAPAALLTRPHPAMNKILLMAAAAVALVGCADDAPEPVVTPTVGEAEVVTPPADDALMDSSMTDEMTVDSTLTIDPMMDSTMTEGETLTDDTM